MLNNKVNVYMCELFSIGVKNESSIKIKICHGLLGQLS
jgi:hypothetical protein